MTNQHPDSNRIIVCEKTDRWTKLVRRYVRDRCDFEVHRLPGIAFLEGLDRDQFPCFIAVSLDPTNLRQAGQWLFRLRTCGFSCGVVGLAEGFSPADLGWARGLGLDACYFSLTRVQSMIRLAERFFAVPGHGTAPFEWNETLPLDSGIQEMLPEIK